MEVDKIVFLDTETTTSNPDKAKIFELSGLVFDCKSKTIDNTFTYFCNPQDEFILTALTTTGIDPREVKNYKTFEEQLPEIKQSLLIGQERVIYVAHNAPYDRTVIRNAFKDVNIEVQEFVEENASKYWIDTLKLSRYHNVTNNRFKCLNGDEIIDIKYQLSFLIYFFKLNDIIFDISKDLNISNKFHTAMFDVISLFGLYTYLNKYMSMDDMLDMSNKPLIMDTIWFGKCTGLKFTELSESYKQWLLVNSKDIDVIASIKNSYC